MRVFVCICVSVCICACVFACVSGNISNIYSLPHIMIECICSQFVYICGFILHSLNTVFCQVI